MTEKRLIIAGALLGGLAVAFGAFGAHFVKSRFDADAIGWWETAAQYQMWHALAVVGIGLCGQSWARLPAWLLAAGAMVFSGTLYAMAFGAPRMLGAVTPIGGLLMIAGWGLLGINAARSGRR